MDQRRTSAAGRRGGSDPPESVARGRPRKKCASLEKMRQVTLREMRKNADDAARRKKIALNHVQNCDTPRMLAEASGALLRRGFPAGVRARVLAHVLDNPARPCVWAARLLAAHWASAKKANEAAAEMFALLTTHGARDFVDLPTATREKLKKLVRVQIRHLEDAATGWERGPCYSFGMSSRLFPADLEHPRQGRATVPRALEIHPRATHSGALSGLYELRRRVWTQRPPRPPRCLFADF